MLSASQKVDMMAIQKPLVPATSIGRQEYTSVSTSDTCSMDIAAALLTNGLSKDGKLKI